MKVFRRFLRIVLSLFLLLNIMAAFHAYKFTHFYPANEVVKKRPEEMNWWDKTKAIVVGVRFPKSVNSVTPDTTYKTVNFKTADGIPIEAWYTEKSKAKGTVILFHGHGASKSKVLTEANYMYSLGYSTLLVDFRAHGGSGGDVCTIGYKEAEEVKLAYQYLVDKGEKNIVLWGISLGAATITHAISEYHIEPSKIILEMPFGALTDAVKGRVRIMGLPEQPIATLLTFWGGTEQGFWAFSHNPSAYAKSVNCPVLLQWGAKDPRVTREEIDAIYKNLVIPTKKLVVYESAGHESLCKKETLKWQAEVRAFLN